MVITSLKQIDFTKSYSYADYLSWQFDGFVELIKGKIFPMSAPSRMHQKVSGNLHLALGIPIKKTKCEIYHAPFDVRLTDSKKSDREINTVVQPDLCIVCDLSKLDDKGCLGAPEFVIEIVSEKNAARDVKDKFQLYEENGVQEYWLARVKEKTIERFFLENGKYVHKGFFTHLDTINPVLFPEIKIDLGEVFTE